MGKACRPKPAFAGIDTHKDTNMLGLIDALGREIGTWEFPTTLAGCRGLARAIGDTSVPVGIEGTRSYGAGVASCLEDAGFEVYEVIRPKREQRRRGKTDAIDAISAARNVAAGRAHAVKEMDGDLAALRAELMLRGQHVETLRKAAQRLDALVLTAPAGFRERWRPCDDSSMRRLAASRPKDGLGRAARELARIWVCEKEAAARIEAEIAPIARRIAPALIGAPGIGAINAAKIIVAVGSNPERMRSEASFSMLAGTSPIPASSGKTSRFRLNRGGNRQLNCAIHSIAVARMSRDGRTKAYIAKKVGEGKTKKEAIRCLCRYIAREVYRLLTAPPAQVASGRELADRRRGLGLTQREVADAIGVCSRKIGRIENEREFDDAFAERYSECLAVLESAKRQRVA